ncbi:MAG TPA: PEGA domain-containing protein [Polyangiaceae bacterium]|nr:PEGA domain-containing protein [Polyangiaceae bacterium]
MSPTARAVACGLIATQCLLARSAFADSPPSEGPSGAPAGEPVRVETDRPAADRAVSNPEPDKVELARVHFLRAVQFFNDGDFKLSLVEFRRAYEISGNYRVLYNIGQVNHQLSNYTKALTSLERYLAEGGDDVPEDRRQEVSQSIVELNKKVARVRLITNVDVAELWLDDDSQGEIHPGQVVVIDAGDHRLELRRQGYRSALTQVSLTAGENSDLTLNLARAPRQMPMPVRYEPPVSRGMPAGVWLGWFVTGATAVGAVVTGVVAQKHAKDLHDLRDSPTSTSEERENARDRARSFAIASDALTGTALAVGAVSLYFTLSVSAANRRGGVDPLTQLALGPGSFTLRRQF